VIFISIASAGHQLTRQYHIHGAVALHGMPVYSRALSGTEFAYHGWMTCVNRVSDTPGNPGNLLELFFLLQIL